MSFRLLLDNQKVVEIKKTPNVITLLPMQVVGNEEREENGAKTVTKPALNYAPTPGLLVMQPFQLIGERLFKTQ